MEISPASSHFLYASVFEVYWSDGFRRKCGNDFHSATAKTIEEAKRLIEAGFEYVCDIDNCKLFRKRK